MARFVTATNKSISKFSTFHFEQVTAVSFLMCRYSARSIGTRRFCDRIILKLRRVVLMTTPAGIMRFVSTSMQMVMKVEIIPSFTPALKVSIRISKALC